MSLLTVVASPIIIEQPVPISAAQRPDSVMPPSTGGTLMSIIGSATEASASGMSARLATPSRAHIKPTGTISAAPIRYPAVAERSVLPVRPICMAP